MARALCPGASYHEQTVLQSHTCTTSVPTQNNDMYGKEHGQGTSLSGASAAHKSITVCARCTALRGDYAGTSKYSGLKLMLVKSAVTRLLPDQYLSNSVIVFTTNLSFILSNMMKFGTVPVRQARVEFCSVIWRWRLKTKTWQVVVF